MTSSATTSWEAGGIAASSSVKDYLELLKPGVMSLVVFTALCGALISPVAVHPFVLAMTVLCVAVGCGAAGAINMWYDRDIDAIMLRTAKRPIPSGRIQPEQALELGISLSIFSVLLLSVATNLTAGAYLLAAILFYVFIYTVGLKRRTPQNIVIGGAAGAFPPVIGWYATGAETHPLPWLLFLIIFLWTPPHFWSLALYRNQDYQRAGVPMLPVVKGVCRTKHEILIYTLLLAVTTFIPVALGYAGAVYAVVASVLNAAFVYHAVRVWRSDVPSVAMKAFGYSIFYLFALFGGVVFDTFYQR